VSDVSCGSSSCCCCCCRLSSGVDLAVNFNVSVIVVFNRAGDQSVSYIGASHTHAVLSRLSALLSDCLSVSMCVCVAASMHLRSRTSVCLFVCLTQLKAPPPLPLLLLLSRQRAPHPTHGTVPTAALCRYAHYGRPLSTYSRRLQPALPLLLLLYARKFDQNAQN